MVPLSFREGQCDDLVRVAPAHVPVQTLTRALARMCAAGAAGTQSRVSGRGRRVDCVGQLKPDHNTGFQTPFPARPVLQ